MDEEYDEGYGASTGETRGNGYNGELRKKSNEEGGGIHTLCVHTKGEQYGQETTKERGMNNCEETC